MTDSVSSTHGDLSGTTFCGDRTYEIIAPSPIPSWLTIHSNSTGYWTVEVFPTTNTLIGTTATVTIKRQLANYPTISSPQDLFLTFISCSDAILNSTVMDMVDDTFVTASTPHTQSYASILTGTYQDPFCGTLEINWYQSTAASSTPQPIDTSIFRDNKVDKTLTVLTSDGTKANVYALSFEVYLIQFPTVKIMKNAIIQTISDRCSAAEGLTLTAVPQADLPAYFFDGTTQSVQGTFTSSDPGCPINSYSCSLSNYGSSQNCNYIGSAGTSSNFDPLTGVFAFTSNNKDNLQFKEGSTIVITITAIAGTQSDVQAITTNNLIFQCMVQPIDIVWKIPILQEMEYHVNNYDPSWVANPPIVKISPLSSSTTPIPAYDDSLCPYVAPITWTQTKFALHADGTYNTVAYEAPTTFTAQSDMIQWAYPEEIGALATFEFWTNFKNLWQSDPLAPVFNKITILVKYVDGYQYLQVQSYQDIVPMTIDLTTGSETIQFLPPLFKVDSKTNIELNPKDTHRQISLKLVDQTSSELITFMSYQPNADSATSPYSVAVDLAKVAKGNLESFQIIVCWSYGNYSNLLSLCNESTKHTIVNALGFCLTEFAVTISGAKELQSSVYVYSLNDQPATVLDLIAIAQVSYKSADLVCGNIAFKLANETQSTFLTLGTDGILYISTITDQNLLGTHQIEFMAYLKDIDPFAIKSKPIDLTLVIQINSPTSRADEIGNSLKQKKPPRFDDSNADDDTFEVETDKTGQQKIKPVSVSCLEGWSKKLPSIITGTEGEACTTQVNLGAASSFLTYSSSSKFISLGKSLKNAVQGQYLSKITLQDINGLIAIYDLQITLQCSVEDEKKNTQSAQALKEAELETLTEQLTSFKFELQKSKFGEVAIKQSAPKVSIKEITASGLIHLIFSKDMRVPLPNEFGGLHGQTRGLKALKDPLEIIQYYDMIQVELKDESEQDQKVKKAFVWRIETYTQREMKIQLTFDEPQNVSTGDRQDKIKITFKDTRLIFDEFGQEIIKGTQIVRDIPQQFASLKEAKFFNQLSEVVKPVSTGAFSSDIVINSILAGTLQQFWSLVLIQQILILMPLFAVSLPASAEVVYKILFQIASFEMIPTEKFYHKMLANLEDVSPPSDSQIEKYERILGINSVWILPSLGTLLLFMGLYPMMLICYLLLFLFKKCCPCVSCLRMKLRNVVFWSWPIKFFNDSLTVIVINCLINIVYGSWQVEEAAINTCISCVLLGLVILYPALMQVFLYRRHASLTQRSFRRRFGNAYEGLDEQQNRFVLYPLFSYYRRVLIVTSIILFPTTFIVQYFVLAKTTEAMIILIGLKRPFKERSRNRAELFGEMFILFFMYHIFCFTEFVPDVNTQHYIGYSAISLMLLHLLIFYVVLVISTLKKLIRMCRRRQAYVRAKEQASIKKSLRNNPARTQKLRRTKLQKKREKKLAFKLANFNIFNHNHQADLSDDQESGRKGFIRVRGDCYDSVIDKVQGNIKQDLAALMPVEEKKFSRVPNPTSLKSASINDLEKELTSVLNQLSKLKEQKDYGSQLLEEEKVSQSVDHLEDLSFSNINSHSKAYMFAESNRDQTPAQHDQLLIYDMPRVYSQNDYTQNQFLIPISNLPQEHSPAQNEVYGERYYKSTQYPPDNTEAYARHSYQPARPPQSMADWCGRSSSYNNVPYYFVPNSQSCNVSEQTVFGHNTVFPSREQYVQHRFLLNQVALQQRGNRRPKITESFNSNYM